MEPRHGTAYHRAPMAVRRRSRTRFLARIAALLLCLAAVAGLARALGSMYHASTTSRAPATALPSPSPRAVTLADPTPVRAGTAPGTCLAFAPTRGNRGQTVFIDPGHGGIDTGTSGVTSNGTTIYEKNLTLATGLDLLALLRADGYRVVMSRIDDRLLITPTAAAVSAGALTVTGEHDDTEARIACANASHAAALVAIHFNAFADPSINGAETIYDSARPFQAANRRLATLAQHAILARLHADGWAVPDRGVLDDSAAGTPAITAEAAAYGHLLELGPAAAGWLARPSAMPGILVEPLFLSHVAEADVAASTAGQRAIARGLAAALATFLTPAAQP